MVRKRTFAHVLGIEFDGAPAQVVLTFRPAVGQTAPAATTAGVLQPRVVVL